MKKSCRKKKKFNIRFCIRDIFITIGVICAACILGAVLLRLGGEKYIQLVFVLAVAVISRFTDGYFYGLMASLAGMFAVNYAFTYPYFKLNFLLAGYPVIFTTLLLVSVTISMLTTQIKQQSRIKTEMEKEKMRGNLLRAVSHDIRTPLTSISGAASAILENSGKLDKDNIISLVSDIKEDADQLICMVENILTVTRIGNKTGRISKNAEAAEEMISEAVMKFRKRYDTPVSISIPDELMLIPMDAILIEQVIVNIMENSVIHGADTTKIELSLFEESGYAVFCISDDGGGIPEKLLSGIFDGYFIHANDERGDVKHNMGIGLSVCMTIVKAHGGKMTARNENGGAVFEFSLPLKE